MSVTAWISKQGQESVKFVIEEADLVRDRAVLIETLQRHLSEFSCESRFDWLYTQNPYGQARLWLARNSENAEVVGASAAFRCRATVDGAERNGWVLGDFCVADKYRTLGPALQLQRTTLAGIKDGESCDFYYDFPSMKMMAVYKRCHIVPAGRMIRLAKPLRLEHNHPQTGRVKAWMRPAITFGNSLLRALDTRIGHQGQWRFDLHADSCGDEFTMFNENIGMRESFETRRSAQYLNWRYIRHPQVRYEILTAREGQNLKGYVIFSSDNEAVTIAEWRVGNNLVLLKALMRELIRRLHPTATRTLSCFLRDTDPRIPLLRRMGFWPRESSPLVEQWPGSTNGFTTRLLLMQGDRES